MKAELTSLDIAYVEVECLCELMDLSIVENLNTCYFYEP
jgi:hypothetical protein